MLIYWVIYFVSYLFFLMYLFSYLFYLLIYLFTYLMPTYLVQNHMFCVFIVRTIIWNVQHYFYWQVNNLKRHAVSFQIENVSLMFILLLIVCIVAIVVAVFEQKHRKAVKVTHKLQPCIENLTYFPQNPHFGIKSWQLFFFYFCNIDRFKETWKYTNGSGWN